VRLVYIAYFAANDRSGECCTSAASVERSEVCTSRKSLPDDPTSTRQRRRILETHRTCSRPRQCPYFSTEDLLFVLGCSECTRYILLRTMIPTSVCLSVTRLHVASLCKNGSKDRSDIWGENSVRQKKHSVRRVKIPHGEGERSWGDFTHCTTHEWLSGSRSHLRRRLYNDISPEGNFITVLTLITQISNKRPKAFGEGCTE